MKHQQNRMFRSGRRCTKGNQGRNQVNEKSSQKESKKQISRTNILRITNENKEKTQPNNFILQKIYK